RRAADAGGEVRGRPRPAAADDPQLFDGRPHVAKTRRHRPQGAGAQRRDRRRFARPLAVRRPADRFGRPDGASRTVNRFRAVPFDFVNTLVNYSLSAQEALKETLMACGILRDEEDWPAFLRCFDPASSHHWRKRDAYTAQEMTYLTFRD